MDIYTHGHSDSVLTSHRSRTIANSAAYLAPLLAEGQRVLDVGCGPGTITAELADRVGPGAVIGIDPVSAVLAEARQQCQGRPNLRFETGDVYALDAETDTFDIVHAHQVLQHLSDPVRALAEMRRVCRPGGVVAARDADYEAFTWAPADPLLDRWLDVYRMVARGNEAQPDAGRYLKGWAQAAGLVEVEAGASVWCFSSDDERAWWGELWARRVVESALAEQAVERGLANRHELTEIAAAWRRWSMADDGWFIVPHGEILARAPGAPDSVGSGPAQDS